MSRFLTLSAAERMVVVLASLGLLVVPMVLRAAGLARLMRHLARCRPTVRKPRVFDPIASHRIVTLVEGTAASLPWASTCLHRALVAAWLMRQAHRTCRLVLGVPERAANDFSAHAWIELAHEPPQTSTTSAYTPICGWAIVVSPQHP